MRLLCYGDSNTYGYDPCSYFGGRYPSQSRWVDILAKMIGWELINAGENGREIPKQEKEIRLFQALLSQECPDYLIVMLGGNDLLQGATPTLTTSRMESFLGKINSLKPNHILLIGPPPKQLGTWVPTMELVSSSLELSRQYQKLARKTGIHFADAADWKIEMAYDGVHYTEKGHIAFAEGIYQVIKQIWQD